MSHLKHYIDWLQEKINVRQNDKEMNKIKSCPFCGKKPAIISTKKGETLKAGCIIICDNSYECGVTPSCFGDTKKQVAKIWNIRYK